MKQYRIANAVAAAVLAITASASWAGQISLDMVTVGNPGNQPDDTGFGKVDYVYSIGKYEVTAGQYTAFLNAVAANGDEYKLYDDHMSGSKGSGITRTESGGTFSYSVNPDFENRPVNYVSWGDAARFVNWLHNGQPNGDQDETTTEDGAYTLNGAMTDAALMAVTRNDGARFWIPTEDEWYKAAYHKNDGVTGNYWDYPTGSDDEPSNALPDPGNSANFKLDDSYTIGDPDYTTVVGAFENSASPYGTFDQGGNLSEWNETVVKDGERGVRGGSWDDGPNRLLASYRDGNNPLDGDNDIGFRVASVPEPASGVLMLCGALAGLLWWKRRA